MTRTLESSEIELVATDAEVFNDVGYNAARHVPGVPGECDESIRTERVGEVTVTPAVAQVDAADLPKTAFQLPAVVRRVFAHASGGQNELITESGGDGAPCLQKRFQVGFGRLLKTQDRLAPVASVCVAARKNAGFGNPHAIFVTPCLDFRNGNDHIARTITVPAMAVNDCRPKLEVLDL
jgi:hypothetical protein